MADEIINEIWQIKDAIADEFNGDVHALVAHLRAKKHGEDRIVVDLRSRKQNAEAPDKRDPIPTGEHSI